MAKVPDKTLFTLYIVHQTLNLVLIAVYLYLRGH